MSVNDKGGGMATRDIDLTGGMEPDRDLVLAAAPEEGKCRQGDNMWVFDDRGRFALPRIGIEALGSQWLDRGMQANVAFADGRVLNGSGCLPRYGLPGCRRPAPDSCCRSGTDGVRRAVPPVDDAMARADARHHGR